MRRWSWTGLSAATCALLLGVLCEGTNTPPPCEAEACDTGQVRVCLQYCVDEVSRDDALGEYCVHDPCHPALVTSGTAILCPPPLACSFIDASTGIGRCADFNAWHLTACNPYISAPVCGTGSYCRPFDDAGCPGLERPNNNAYQSLDGICMPPQTEGSPCDGNWGATGCLLCEPGTECVQDPSRGYSLRCMRACDEDTDCPCEGEFEADCSQGGYCDICIQHHHECPYRAPDEEMDALCDEDPGEEGCLEWLQGMPHPCCDENDVCAPVSFSGGGIFPGYDTGFCCRPEDQECTFDQDCCPGLRCNATTDKCAPCEQLGEVEVNGCCTGLKKDPMTDRCIVECDEEAHDEGDPCPACQEDDGEWTCLDSGEWSCVATTSTMVPDDDCDGVDDDCDTEFDEGTEGLGDSCTFIPEDCELELEGEKVCNGHGELECEPTEEYCRYDFDVPLTWGELTHGDVAACTVTNTFCDMGMTTGHAACPPNMYCRQYAGDPNRQACWEFNRPPSGAMVPEYACTGVVCWEPGDLNTTGTSCP